jgi:hypothetical protein
MRSEIETQQKGGTPVVKKAFAGLVLIVVAALAIKVVIGLVMGVFWIVVGLAAVIAVLWALKTIVW